MRPTETNIRTTRGTITAAMMTMPTTAVMMTMPTTAVMKAMRATDTPAMTMPMI